MEWYGITDKGSVRPTNQDVFQIEAAEGKNTVLLVVCDGMGGANAGNVASRFAAQSFVDVIKPALQADLLDAKARQRVLQQGLEKANETVFALAGRQPEFRGMGTTLVAALIRGREATLLNVGDSRAYLLTAKAIEQLTEDHSYVNEMRRQGRITEEAARNHPQKNLITRAVGVDGAVEGDLFEVRLEDAETLLLCSDGLTNMAEDAAILKTVLDAPSLELAGDSLVTIAQQGGGKDNITAVLFRLGGKPAGEGG